MYIYKTAVIGAGTMGAEIAQVMTYANIPVVLKDVKEEFVASGIKKIKSIYDRRVQKGKMTEEEVQKKMSLVLPATTYEPFKDVDLVVEAVPENMALKKTIFADLDAACPPGTILATNTSSLSISEIASATKRPEKVIGLHFFFPAHVMKLVEVIPGLLTDLDAVDSVFSFSEALRKIPIRVNECPGFLVNRLLMPYLNEAAFCLQDGAATMKQIDEVCVKFGFPMGPFTLIDNIGLDVAAEVAKVLAEGFGPRMQVAAIWDKVLQLKRYGVKSGAGFYNHKDPNDKTIDTIVSDLQKEINVKKTVFSMDRLLCPMINEAALCLQEKVSSASDVEKGMVAGIGFPIENGGLLHYADVIGVDHVLSTLVQLSESIGPRFWPAPLLRQMVGAGLTGKKAGRGFFQYK